MASIAILNDLKTDIDAAIDPYDAATDAGAARTFVKNIDKISDIIKKQIAKASETPEAMIKPGNQSAPFPYEADTVTALVKTLEDYAGEFFKYDAIAKNHNGVTSINVPYNDAAGNIVTMSNFYNQITTGNPALAGFLAGADDNFVPGAPADALKYYMNGKQKPPVPLKRYEMQEWHYRIDASFPITNVGHYVQNSHSHMSYLPEFDKSGTLRTDPNGAHPNPNSFEARSLQVFFDYAKERNFITEATAWNTAFSGWKLLDNSPILKNNAGYGPVPFRILPFCLQACLIRTSQPTDKIYRPISRYNDVWCKIYKGDTQEDGNDGPLIPYDRNLIYLGGPNVGMVETWDGFVRFVSISAPDGSRINIDDYIDQPLGAVVIGNEAQFNFQTNVQPSQNRKINAEIKREATEWLSDFYPKINLTRMKMFNATAAQYKAYMFPGGTRTQFGASMVSNIMGLAMYVYNLYRIGSITLENAQITGGYGSIKKNIKNKTMNKRQRQRQRQRQRRSKSKSMSMLKSAKRTFYRTNKRNKTSRHYH